VRQRISLAFASGARYQVRTSGGIDPATSRQLIHTGAAATEGDATSAEGARIVAVAWARVPDGH